jgi:hypothetical protein
MSELSPEARALLAAAANADDPTPEARARADAAARIALAMHGATDIPPLAPPRAHAAVEAPPPRGALQLGASSGWKLAAGAIAVATAGLLGAIALRPPAPPRSAPPAAEAPAAEAPAPGPTSRVAAGEPRAASVTARRRFAAAARPPAAEAVPAVRAAAPRSQPAPRSAAARVMASRTGAAHEHAGLQAEVALIASANALIRDERWGDAERALSDHARRFPRGALREERGALALIALCARAPGERAERAAKRFLRGAPQSVLVQRVRAACGASLELEP